MSLRPATVRAIEHAHRFDAVYRGYLASHLPMALVALDRMGADDSRIAAYAADYESRLQPPGPVFTSWVEYFRAHIAAESPEAVLRAWLPKLETALGSAAFHGAIRAAYALETESATELAHALAYWLMSFHALTAQAAPSGDKSPADILAAIAGDPAHAGQRLPGNGIAARAAAAARLPEFAAWVRDADPARLGLDELAASLIRAYCANGDFTILHGVTGTHAVRMLAPYFGSDPSASLWTALVATYVGAGSPPVEGYALEGDDSLAWPQIHAAAVRCEDEHDIKLAYSCWREWQRSGDDLYRRAASARVAHALQEKAAG